MKNQQVKKAVIPVAGYGTRFLPATKSIPKEMFPIIDKPTIHLIVEEAINSGIESILFVISRNKFSLVNYFDYNKELNDLLKEKNKLDLLKQVNELTDKVKIQFIIQKEQLGLGHAILQAEDFVGNDPFAVLLGDDIVVSENEEPALKQCIDSYNDTKSSVVGVQEVPLKDVNKYGIVEPKDETNIKNIELKSLVEKPDEKDTPSNLAVLGRYVLTPEIFEELKNTKLDIRNEIELTDAINSLCKKQKVYARLFTGRRFDIGMKRGFVQATIHLALKDKELKNDILKFIKEEIENDE